MREGRADREGVCEMRLCNCSDIFIESPPSLSCVLQRASLTPVDVQSSRGAVFSIIPEAIVRAASERLTVASWDFTKTQQNTRRRGWDKKIRGGGGVQRGDRREGRSNEEKNACAKYYITLNLKGVIVCISVEAKGGGFLYWAFSFRSIKEEKCETCFPPGGLHLLALIQHCNSVFAPFFSSFNQSLSVLTCNSQAYKY